MPPKSKSLIRFKTEYIVPDGHTNTSDHPHQVRHKKPDLLTEMVPKTAWGSNVRDHVKASDWDKIKDAVIALINDAKKIFNQMLDARDSILSTLKNHPI